ncbi:MAG: S9 family peptidase [Planctomycetota bacterium]
MCSAAIVFAGVPQSSPADELDITVRKMISTGASWSPSLSPHGDEVAYVSTMSGTPQVWISNLEKGEHRQITFSKEKPAGRVLWSPTGDRLAFSLSTNGGANSQVFVSDTSGHNRKRVTDGMRESNRLECWTPDGRRLAVASNRLDAEALDIFAFEDGKEGLQLIAKNPNIGHVRSFTSDMSQMLLWRLEGQNDSNLYFVDIDKRKEELLTPHEMPSLIRGGDVAAHGKRVYLATNIYSDRMNFGYIDLGADSLTYHVLADRADAVVDDFCLSPTGDKVALLWNCHGRNEFALLDLNSSESLPIDLPCETAGSLCYSANGKRLAYVASGSTTAPDIYVFNLETLKTHKVTKRRLGIPTSELAKAELVRFEAHDGLEISGWLYRSKEDLAGPLAISFHGGPESQERPMFGATYQALVQSGISVFAPNIRGSTGFGRTFAALDNGPLRRNAIQDIESCADVMIRMNVSDPKRIGVMGISYGGYMAMAAVTEYPNRFAAAANISGIVNFETWFANTEPWRAEIGIAEYGNPATDSDLLRTLSPIHKIAFVRTPTLVIHGANDSNVPLSEAQQIQKALSDRGCPVTLIEFPDEGHSINSLENRIHATTALVNWFDQYLCH